LQIERLTLTAFRNYTHLVWRPETGVTVFTGANGAGKTNLMEAVSLLAPGRGLRGAPGAMLAQNGASLWGVAARIRRGDDLHEIGTGADPAGGLRRIFRLNGQGIRSQAEIARLVACVWATPQMDRLFTEGASGRRRFLDRLAIALSPGHARETAAHDRALAQRNKLLADRYQEDAWLRASEDSIARHAVAVTAARMALVEDMNACEPAHPDFPRTTLALDCAIAAMLADMPALAVEEHLRARLAQDRESDAARGSSGIGAHRTDFVLHDHETGRPAALSSSGQQKAMLLGTVLAHARLVERLMGTAPILLLDEPLVHLDERRREALLATLSAATSTVLLSGTDGAPFDSLIGKAAFVEIADAQLRERPR
jgi:DNA replication and repair protein RecF